MHVCVTAVPVLACVTQAAVVVLLVALQQHSWLHLHVLVYQSDHFVGLIQTGRLQSCEMIVRAQILDRWTKAIKDFI